MQDRVFDGKQLRARLVLPPGDPKDTIVITFKGRVVRQALRNNGFGEDFLLKRGIAAVHVTADVHHWYQVPEMEALLPVLLQATHGHGRVITYGSSMGAYAALLFSRQLGASRAVGLSPLFSIDPALLPWETRWAEDLPQIGQFRYDDMAAGIGPETERILFYDPYSQDRRHIALLGEIPGPRMDVAMPAAGHPCGRFMLEAGVLTALTEPLFTRPAEPFDTIAARAAVRAGRRKSTTYWALLCKRALESRWPSTAMAAAKQAMAIDGTHPRSQNAIRAAQALHDKLEARRAARKLAASP